MCLIQRVVRTIKTRAGDEVKQTRMMQIKDLETREETDEFVIAGYFAKYNSVTQLFEKAFEEIMPGAFDNSLVKNDIRALVDHETRLVLGRTKSGTLTLHSDDVGLYGTIRINKDDTDAVNLYQRVKRGDIDQCSFGFNIVEEEVNVTEDDAIHWKLIEVDLHEVSVVTFPAYADTSVEARKNDLNTMKKRKRQKHLASLKERISK